MNGSSEMGIAVVGIGCRLPGGVQSPADYWQLLRDGVDAISETPDDRWNLDQFYYADEVRPGKTQSRWGGYVEGIDRFDPQLFGISPKEASSMDPQQRMLLEVAWRAMEDAGHPISQMAGRKVAVYVGISSFDYAIAGLSFADRGVIGSYHNTGSSTSIAANRISYCFDFRGPSLAVDTACSSSLVALHLACESLNRGESEMALVGGVNALLLPDFYVGFSQLGVLSPDGRCKTFDSRANGYVRSEGAGMVMLKPVDAAIRDRDEIYCVIRGTAINQDGHTQGLTVPNGEAQQKLVREACQLARVAPEQIQYVEAHGTGTPVGDPIEASALGAVLSANRSADRRCLVGSVKTNIGHLEAGAGIASLIKVALSLHHRKIPAHLHLENPNPSIDFDALRLSIPNETVAWPHPEDRLLAGINGFGYGGANAHVILEAAPNDVDKRLSSEDQPATVSDNAQHPNKVAQEAAQRLLPISARSTAALADMAKDFSRFLETNRDNLRMQDVAASAAFRRGHYEYRRAVPGQSLDDWTERLGELADELRDGSSAATQANPKLDAGILFVCCGQGTQWWGMGRGMYESNETYRATVDRCDREFSRHVRWSLVDELNRDSSDSRMHETSIAQPALFALQIALSECWAEIGVRPSVVVGHSVGEIASAYLSGALSFEDACLVAVERGRAMDLASSSGAMIAVGLTEQECQEWIERTGATISIAAINGPTSVTLSGKFDQVESLATRLETEGVFCKRLPVEYAFHSELMDPVRDELLRTLSGISARPTNVDLLSTVSGDYIDGTELGTEYWWHNVRQGVRFSDAISRASQDGFEAVIELGPHPTLTFAINECCQTIGNRVHVIPSLRRDEDDSKRFSESIAMAYESGIEIDWSRLYRRTDNPVSLPVYPFQRQKLWAESRSSQQSRTAESHPLLGVSLDQPTPEWQARVDLDLQRIFRDHRVRGNCVLPAAAMIETAIAARRNMGHEAAMTFGRFQFQRACMLPEDNAIHFRTSYDPDQRILEFSSRTIGEEEWLKLANVELLEDALPIKPFSTSIEDIRAAMDEDFVGGSCYEYCERLGLDYGEHFRGVIAGRRRNGAALAEVRLESNEGSQYRHGIDPAILDSCFHSMIVADPSFDHSVYGLSLPAEIQRIQFIKPVPRKVFVHARIVHRTLDRLVADLDVLDERGDPCLLIRGFLSKRVSGGETEETVKDWLYCYRWAESGLADEGIVSVDAESERAWCVFADSHGISASLIDQLRSRGDRVVVIDHGEQYQMRDGESFTINPERREDFEVLLQELYRDRPGLALHCVYLWGVDAPAPELLDDENLDRSTQLTSLAPMHLVQAWDATCESRVARLSMVTAGAQSPDDRLQDVAIAQMPLVGFARVIVSEFGGFRTRLIDLPGLSGLDINSNTRLLIDEMINEFDHEDEVMYRDGVRFAHRFVPTNDQTLPVDSAGRLQSRLETGDSMGIDDLRYRALQPKELGAEEVEIAVSATGLNFSDVMKALRLYPSDVELGPTLGAECSGVITRCGSNVTKWVPGDEVMAVAPGSFATHVCVDANLVARKPGNLTHQQAAAVPIAFLTAAHAVEDCARMRAGETLLVHAASGGVGLAAMQIAKLNGVRVFATAGNDEKRDHVRECGAELVMDSRSLKFADEVMHATGGEGIDAILNSLPGEAIRRGLASLKIGGRFLEIGKRDIYGDHPLGMYPLRNNIAFFAIDLDQLFKTQPVAMGEKLAAIGERFESGELQPLPVDAWSANDTDAAFRFMQQAKHIGKVTVSYDERPGDLYAGDPGQLQLAEDGTYWVVGGLGGFGLEVARWLGTCGAKTIVLSGRSGKTGEEAEEVIGQLRAGGTDVHILPVDATDPNAVEQAVAKIQAELPALKGVIHSAMVLEDRLLVDLDRDTLERVLRPKVLGGWNLHRATLDLNLDQFIIFSSLSSVFGHAGQANYSAANAFLDGLAHHRRSLGLPGLVMNWGHLGEVGYLAQREELGNRLRRQGVLSFTVEQAFKSLEHAIQNELIQTSVLRMDWTLWRGLGITGDVSPRFAHLIHNTGADDSQLASADQIREAPAAQRLEIVDGMLRFKVAALLGFNESQLDTQRSLVELGLDSLMAVELRNWVESQIEVALPIAQLMRDTSLADLVELICVSLGSGSTPEDHAADTDETLDKPEPASDLRIDSVEAKQLLETLPGLPADEVTMLLSKMLREQDSATDEQP